MPQNDKLSINMIGAGNVAWHLSQFLYSNGFKINTIYSFHLENAKQLADLVQAKAIDKIADIEPADMFILSLRDSVYQDFIVEIPKTEALVVHTSGSLPKEILKNISPNYGVLYPFQTFNKIKKLSIEQIPFCIEASNEQTQQLLDNLIDRLNGKYYHLNFHQREKLHLAGVFACNFSNALYGLAEDILKSENIDFEILKPLISETAQKIKYLSPQKAQTGPAARQDYNIINKHIALLDNDNIRNLYRFLSQIIFEQQKK